MDSCLPSPALTPERRFTKIVAKRRRKPSDSPGVQDARPKPPMRFTRITFPSRRHTPMEAGSGDHEPSQHAGVNFASEGDDTVVHVETQHKWHIGSLATMSGAEKLYPIADVLTVILRRKDHVVSDVSVKNAKNLLLVSANKSLMERLRESMGGTVLKNTRQKEVFPIAKVVNFLNGFDVRKHPSFKWNL